MIITQEDLKAAVIKYGFLPFFTSSIPGFSIDELTPQAVWDEYLGLGPWLWRDDIAKAKSCIYGKFFKGKVGYISKDYFAHFANYRRDGYDLDARYDDGLLRYEDKVIFDFIEKNGPISTPELKRMAGVENGKTAHFDWILTRLQMMTYIVPADFIIPRDKAGNKKYSYGTTVYDLPERWLGQDAVRGAYSISPQTSFQIITEKLMNGLHVGGNEVEKLLG